MECNECVISPGIRSMRKYSPAATLAHSLLHTLADFCQTNIHVYDYCYCYCYSNNYCYYYYYSRVTVSWKCCTKRNKTMLNS